MTEYHCKVTLAGINMDGGVRIELDSHDFDSIKECFAPESVKKEMLAIALVAFTTETLVKADLEPNDKFIHFLALEQGKMDI